MDRVIPAFYACYLLRSTVRHQSLYVGSTPNPVRRLKQHNGLVQGGAVKTSKTSLRPWEMVCLVTGFPSNIAALQFEWAWQNPHLTRHIASSDRVRRAQDPATTGRIGRRPRVSLTDRLGNLHILLRARSFQRWPLNVVFFAEDVHKIWQRQLDKTPGPIRSGIEIGMHQSLVDQAVLTADAASQPVGIHALDVTYQHMKPILEKGRVALAHDSKCAVCQSSIDPSKSMALLCTSSHCHSVSHLDCLAQLFLDREGEPNAVVPTQGQCPTCQVDLKWADLVQHLSLRIRGDEEVAALFKEPKPRKKASSKSTSDDLVIDDETFDNDAMAEESEDEIDGLAFPMSSGFRDVEQLQPAQDQDEWRSVDGLGSTPSPKLDARTLQNLSMDTAMNTPKGTSSRKLVIEDSDWDEAEIIE